MSEPVILVTGATGNIGRALVQRLSSAGARVIAGSPSGESVAGAPGR
ncbi:MAG: NAD-dependent epimerase/dehydratase family protein, partial [Betaproteobacteria bacterium]